MSVFDISMLADPDEIFFHNIATQYAKIAILMV